MKPLNMSLENTGILTCGIFHVYLIIEGDTWQETKYAFISWELFLDYKVKKVKTSVIIFQELVIPGTAMNSCVVWLFGGNYNIAIATIRDYFVTTTYFIPIAMTMKYEKKQETQRHINTKKLW